MNETAIAITCSGCAKTYKWKPELAGKKAKCKCGSTVRFPTSDPEPPAAVPELDLLSDPDINKPAKKPSKPAVAKSPASSAAKAPAKAPAKMPDLEGVGGGEYDLNEPVSHAPVARAAGGCAGCGAELATGAVVCIKCGMNQKTGKKLGTAVEKGASPARMSERAAAKEPAAAGGLMSSVWVWIGGVIVLAGIVGAVGMFAIPGKTGAQVCLGVAIAGGIIHVIGTIWGLRLVAGDNIALRLACRFVPFLALVLIIMKSVSDWEEMKGSVLTMLTGIVVAVMGIVMFVVASARLGPDLS